MSREIWKETGKLNQNLEDSLRLWQKMPDSTEYSDKVEDLLKETVMHGNLNLKVKKDVVGKLRDGSVVITKTTASAHGKENVDGVIFETSDDLKIRVGSIAGKSYLLLDGRIEKTLAFFRPEDVLSLMVQR
jgi:hypothetical protein